MGNKSVLRVGVYNNFNFTEKELAELSKYSDEFDLFVNSNSFVTIDGKYPSIATINPYLNSWQAPVGDLSNLKACRVKWVEGALPDVYKAQTEAIEWCVDNAVPVLITFMRFVSRCSMLKFVCQSSEHLYRYCSSYYRLPDDTKAAAFGRIISQFDVRDSALFYACDLSGKGCPDCGNCARLTYGKSGVDIYGLSLSCSGDKGKCLFHCPDCWAKRLAAITKFKFDVVTANSKQRGVAHK